MPIHFVIGAALVAVVFVMVTAGALETIFTRLGLAPEGGLALLLISLLGSLVNMLVGTIKHADDAPAPAGEPPVTDRWLIQPVAGHTVLAVNVGGAVVPVAFAGYLIVSQGLHPGLVLISTALVAAVCYYFSRPIPRVGIGMPVLIAPVAAAVVAVTLGGEQSTPLAYACGVLGVLIGADLLRINDVRRLSVPVASLGGAGVIDGIYLTGIIAALLA